MKTTPAISWPGSAPPRTPSRSRSALVHAGGPLGGVLDGGAEDGGRVLGGAELGGADDGGALVAGAVVTGGGVGVEGAVVTGTVVTGAGLEIGAGELTGGDDVPLPPDDVHATSAAATVASPAARRARLNW
ncbi:MAG TPA: hypothetical protein VGH30_10220 [Jatrophihabitantaceae bacterium]